MCIGIYLEGIVWNAIAALLVSHCLAVIMQESLSALLVPMVIFLMEVQYGDVHVTCSRSRELNDILLLPLHLQYDFNFNNYSMSTNLGIKMR